MNRPANADAWRSIVVEQEKRLREALGDENFEWLEEKVNANKDAVWKV